MPQMSKNHVVNCNWWDTIPS